MRGAPTLTEPANQLVAALPESVRGTILACAEQVHLPLKTTIYEPGVPVRFVYLPVDCIISVVKVMDDGAQIEVVTVGREGLTGAQALLDGSAPSSLTYVQIAGEALRVPFDTFRNLCRESPSLDSLVGKYLSAQLDVLAQSLACNRLHYVNERCARWLLTTHDRIGRAEFGLTHEALAVMLGVRRAGVSIAAAGLQQAGYISYSRGRFVVRDPEGLMRAACECYGAINEAYERRRLPQG